MNRRAFITRLASATVGVAAVLHVPASVLAPTPAAARFIRDGAIERLRAAYLAYQRKHGDWPDVIVVGRELYEAYEGELVACQRFMSTQFGHRSLMFKGAAVLEGGAGWAIESMSSMSSNASSATL